MARAALYPNTDVWISQCKNGAGHRVNMINVLKKEQSLRDRGRNATGIGRDLGEKLAKKEGIRAPE